MDHSKEILRRIVQRADYKKGLKVGHGIALATSYKWLFELYAKASDALLFVESI
jgi:hypothetical protein